MISSPFQTSYPDSFRIMLLEPGIRELKEQNGNKNTLKVVMRNLFRQMECWRYDFSSLPMQGRIHDHLVYDPGMPAHETVEVYQVLDAVFKEVFPTQARLSRDEAAVYMEGVVRNVSLEVSGKEPAVAGCKQHLVVFMEKLLESLNELSQKPANMRE